MDLDRLAAQAEAHINAGRLEEAGRIYSQLIAQRPQDANLHHLLGLVYAEQGRRHEAEQQIRQAISIDSRKAVFHRSLGDVLQANGDLDEAVKAYENALDLAPDEPSALLNAGNAFHRAGDTDRARSCFERILAGRPDHPQACNNIGKVLYDQGFIDDSLEWYNKSIKADAKYAEAHFNRAVALLAKGDYTQGWAAYEWRFKRAGDHEVYPHKLSTPRWDGASYWGERLLVHCEQGLGDVIQFCRYLPMVKALGGTLILEVHAPLIPLLEGWSVIDELIPFDAAKPPNIPFDQHIALLSLPLLFQTKLDSIPIQVPYLQAPHGKRAHWQSRLKTEGLRVGLVWSGSSTDPRRALSLAGCQSWWQIGNIDFFSLQKGEAAEQLSGLPPQQMITALGDQLVDFSDTAAIIANLDLVISIDTAVAHLAGAMGKPVWVLLPFAPDWRWLLERSDSPWYPTARLYRQAQRADWSGVVAQVAAALEALAQSQVVPPAEPGMKQEATSHATVDPKAQELFDQGHLSLQAGDAKQAIKFLQKAITLDPRWAEGHFSLGCAYHEMGRLSQAINAYQSACRLDPRMKLAHTNLGLAFQQEGHLEQAAACYEQAIRLHGDLVKVFNNLGVVRQSQGDLGEATRCYEIALRIDPSNADAHYNLGNIHLEQGELEDAAHCFKQAIVCNPRHVKACGNLGCTYHRLGALEQAIDYFNRALELEPGYAEAHLNRAISLLLVGDWENGWPDYEWRFRCQDWARFYPHRLYGERWNGTPFKGKTLLVHSEQGIGDALLFVRYLPQVKACGGRVIFEARKSLMRLFENLEGVDELIELSADKPPARHYHLYIPLCSLPGLFDSLPGALPNQVPYLKADPVKVDQWRKRLPPEGLNVGLVWSGNETYKERSCALADLAPLAFVKGINWIGLQKGPAAAQALPVRLPRTFQVTNWGDELDDFQDTAAAIDNLDLVISIDTAVAHLAGALAKPVWVLLPAVPDWRWLLERSQSPWYPTMHLFRQARSGDWARVVAHLSATLERWRHDPGG